DLLVFDNEVLPLCYLVASRRVLSRDDIAGLGIDILLYFAGLGRCALVRSPLTLERLFMGSSLAQGGILACPTIMPEAGRTRKDGRPTCPMCRRCRASVALKTIRDYRCEIIVLSPTPRCRLASSLYHPG